MMKKLLTIALAAMVGLFAFAACSNTVASMETSAGGEVEVTASEVGSVEQTVAPANMPDQTATANYESLDISYTDPEGYTKTADAGGVVTYTLDGVEIGKIVYVPEIVQAAVTDKFYEALKADEEQLKEYAKQFAANFNEDFTATPVTVNGYDAIEIDGTISDADTDTPRAEAKALIIAIGDKIVTVNGIANEATAQQIEMDMDSFVNSFQVTPTGETMPLSEAASDAMSAIESAVSGATSSAT